MMKKGIAATVLFFTLMWGCVSKSEKALVLVVDTLTVELPDISLFLSDSLHPAVYGMPLAFRGMMISPDSLDVYKFNDSLLAPDGEYAFRGGKPSAFMGMVISFDPPVFLGHWGDTVRYHQFELKNSCVLHCIPFIEKSKTAEGYIVDISMYYRLESKDVDKTLKLGVFPKYRDEILADFNHYFAIRAEVGNPPEFDLFDKRTGELAMHGAAFNANIECEAFIYYNYPDGDYQYYIYDLNTGLQTLMPLPEDTIKHPWVVYNTVGDDVYIKGKRNGYYVLGVDWKKYERDEFLIKIPKSRGHVADKDSPGKVN